MTMNLSLAGMVGALVGLAVGWLDWKMISAVLRRRQIERSKALSAKERAGAQRRLGLLLKAVFVLCLVGIPLLGYLTGVAIGG